MLNKIKKSIEQSKENLTYRELPKYAGNYLDFSSNDYLGLSKNPEVIEAGIEASRMYGSGATGSRLLSGNSDLFENFEKWQNAQQQWQAYLFNQKSANEKLIEWLKEQGAK